MLTSDQTLTSQNLKHKAYKYRIYPTTEQQTLIHQIFGCCRFVFNHFLEKWNDAYQATGKGLSYNACATQLPNLKVSFEWLKSVDSIALQSAVRNVADSFDRFFKKQNRIHEKITNTRHDFLHQLSTKLIRENQTISVETLSVSNMLKDRKLAKSISDSSWTEFIRQLTYKAEWYGRTIKHADPFAPTSQTCHVCGYIHKEVKDLSVREWTCPSCNTTHDRDVNAAENIKRVAV